MKCETINSRAQWEDFLKKFGNATTFVQSWNWGELQLQEGEEVFRHAYFKGNELAGFAQCVLVKARRGHFLFVPHGPVIKDWAADDLVNKIFDHLKSLAKERQALFLRVSPYLLESVGSRALLRRLGFRPAPIHMHAELTWTLELAPPPETLLKNMRKGTRYAINKAAALGVKVLNVKDESILARDFFPLFAETAKRHIFVPFSLEFLKNELRIFAKDNEAGLFLAEYQGRTLAGALIIFHGASAYYHQGASLSHLNKVPAAHAVQWAAILEAKKRGLKHYNFWGISGETNPKHPWFGITFFKKGFGGFETRLAHAHDYPLSWRYNMTYIFEFLRRLKRGL